MKAKKNIFGEYVTQYDEACDICGIKRTRNDNMQWRKYSKNPGYLKLCETCYTIMINMNYCKRHLEHCTKINQDIACGDCIFKYKKEIQLMRLIE